MASSKVFLISVALHLLFGVGAGYIIVQNIAAKRKMTFSGGPPTTNRNTRALEHKVAMGKKKNMMSAPAQAKRITTNGLAKIALPDMPSMPSATDAMPNRMAGMGGFGFGPGGGGGGGMGSGGGGTVNFFGMRSRIKNVVFVVDISGSMVQGNKNPETYARLENEVAKVIQGLAPTTQFGIVAFSGGVEVYRQYLTSARADEKSRAIKWFKSQSPVEYLKPKNEQAKAKHQGTRADLGLDRAFKMKPETIFFVSDGEPSGVTADEVLSGVAEKQKNLARPAVINAVAYLSEGGELFMRELAKQNNGTFREVK